MNFKRTTIAAISLILNLALFSVSYGAPLDALYPKNGATDVTPGDISLVWEKAEGEGYSYNVWGGESAVSMDPLAKNTKVTIADMNNLKPETTYYWRIEAASNDVITSQIWTFTTSDRPTYEISVKYPEDDGKDVPFGQVTLQWNCEEPGATFDVYFGSNAASLERVATNTDKMIWDVTAPQGGKYFWQLVVKKEGNEARSQIWSFTTKGDDSIGGGCTISSSPFSLLLGIPLVMINKISR